MANNFMIKLLLLFFGYLTYHGAVAHISRKPDVASSAVQPGEYQASTLLTSVIEKADMVLHEANTPNLNAHDGGLADMDDDEVLTDVEDSDDEDDDNDKQRSNSVDLAASSSAQGKGIRARLVRYKKSDCEKKKGIGKGKKLKEGKCHRLHIPKRFSSYEFNLKESKGKKGKDDDDSEDDSSQGCRIFIYHDKKCTDEASSANEGSCTDIGDEDGDDKDDKDDKKLHARDFMGKGPKYRSAKFLCDGVNAEEPSPTEPDSENYSTISASSDRYAEPTGLSSRTFTPPPKTTTPFEEPTPTDAPDPDDDEKDPDDDDDDKDDDDDDDDVMTLPPTRSKTKSHKSHKSKKHHSKTQTIVTTTEAAPTTSDGPDTEWS